MMISNFYSKVLLSVHVRICIYPHCINYIKSCNLYSYNVFCDLTDWKCTLYSYHYDSDLSPTTVNLLV